MDNSVYPRVQNKYQKRPQKTNLCILKRSLKTIVKEYCTQSSICGLKHLVDENTPYIERIIWKITLIGALIVSVTLVWFTFTKYYFAPLVTTQMPDGKPIDKIIFPAVGICSNNRISKRAVVELAKKLLNEDRNSKYSEKEMMSLLFGLGQFYNVVMVNSNYSTTETHEALGHYHANDLLRSLTPRCQDLLVRCAWNDNPVDCDRLFDFRLTMNGYCCTFNYLRHSDELFTEKENSQRSINMYQYGNKSTYDYDQGLKVLIRLDKSDDFYYKIPSEGAQLQFSDSYDFPDSPSGSFAMQMINPSVQMTVLVTASFTEASRDIQHVPVKIRNCLFYDESPYLQFYTYSDCMLKCRMLFLLEKCSCTPFNIPKMASSRTCDLTDVPCLQFYDAQSTTVRPQYMHLVAELELDLVDGGLNCPMCYPTCSKTLYNYNFYNVNIYPEVLNMDPDSDRDEWLRGANLTATSIVQIRYGREMADCYGQNVIMKWFDLISNIGSTCGFVTGFSFVSVLEFIYFFTVKLFREIRTKRGNATVTNTPKHKPISIYRQIYWNELAPSACIYEPKLQNFINSKKVTYNI
ncbi:unnamed protein product [Chilo suppressalis]|uniref:Sodium channel protein Nach n=1 Tax=Chilo suppressalis TaxID=168631 RepID=A0ABN8ARP3_CHISP|nr:unnamed protein product [Chilo suppressalis]